MPAPDESQVGPDGQLRKWQPDTRNLEAFKYLGPASGFNSPEDALQADAESGQGSWVPASTRDHLPWAMKAFLAIGFTSAAVTGLGALAAPGVFGGGGAATGAAASLPAGLGTGATVGGVPAGIGTTTALGTAPLPAALGTGAAVGGLPPAVGAVTGLGAPALGVGTTVGGVPPAVGGLTGLGAPGLGGTTMGGLPPAVGTTTRLGAAPAMSRGGGVLGGGTLGRLGAVGQVLGGYQQGAAQGRQAEAQLNLGQDTLRQRQTESARQDAMDRAKLEMDQRTTGQDLENQARAQAFQADYLKAGPFKVTRGEGGFFTPTLPVFEHKDEMADQAYRAAQQRLLSGSDKQFTTPPPIPTPALTPSPKSGWLDKLMQVMTLGTGTVGALGGYRPPTTGGR